MKNNERGSILMGLAFLLIIAGIMLSRGAEVQLNELAGTTDPVVTDAFLTGWKVTYWALAVFVAIALLAAIKTRVYKTENSQ